MTADQAAQLLATLNNIAQDLGFVETLLVIAGAVCVVRLLYWLFNRVFFGGV